MPDAPLDQATRPTFSPNQIPTPPTSTVTPDSHKNFLQGGMPFNKGILSVIVILLVGVITALSVFLMQAKRELATQSSVATPQTQVASPSATVYPLPKERSYSQTITLPKPEITSGVPLNEVINTRRSRRAYSEVPVTPAQISQMLWAGQGITDPITGKRAAPSARESYPMTIFVVIRQVQGIEPGVYEYLPETHSLGKVAIVDDVSAALVAAGVQEAAQKAPVNFLISASFGSYQQKTKSANVNATYMEAGHISQNLYLTAESLGMGTVTMAGFDNAKVTAALSLDPAETIEYIMPFGHRGVEVVEE